MKQILNINDAIYDRLADHHIDVMRLSAGSSDQAVKHLMECDRQTCILINDRANDEGKVPLSRLNGLLRDCLKVNDQHYEDIGNWLEKELQETIDFEAQYITGLVNKELRSARMKAVKAPRNLLKAIIPESPLSGGLLWEWIEGLADGRFSRVRAQMRIGVAAQESAFQIARRIRGTRSLNYRDGVAGQSIRSMRTLVGTAYNHMVNKARHTVYSANGDIVSGVMWSALLDDVTCAECSALDSTVWKVDEAPECPLHLNCRCFVSIIFSPDDDTDYEFPPPQRLTYAEWLNKQTASRQDDILGPTRGAMFRRGLPLKKFTDSSGVRYNLAELRRIEAETMAESSKPPAKSSTKILKNFGYRPDLPDPRDHLFGVAHPEAIAYPVKVSLRDNMPPVWDQGSIGSCVAHACIAAHMFVHKAEAMMSRLYLYYHARYLEGMEDQDSGCAIRDAIKALVKFGVCTEKAWPYQIRKFKTDPPATDDREAKEYRITQYQRLNGHDDYMKCLTQGRPIIFGFSVFSNIYEPMCEKKGLLLKPAVTDTMVGGHAVCCVGYDQNFHENPVFKASGASPETVPNFMYEVRNSWSGNWADGGYFWMDPAILESRDMSDDFWTIFT